MPVLPVAIEGDKFADDGRFPAAHLQLGSLLHDYVLLIFTAQSTGPDCSYSQV